MRFRQDAIGLGSAFKGAIRRRTGVTGRQGDVLNCNVCFGKLELATWFCYPSVQRGLQLIQNSCVTFACGLHKFYHTSDHKNQLTEYDAPLFGT